MSPSSWEELIEQLAARLPELTIDDVLILEASGNRYAELVQLNGGIALDAVSNAFLPPDGQLTAEQERELQAKGWQPPERPLRQNWWHEVTRWPLHSRDLRAIAELMVSTLRDVYGVAGPAEINLRSLRA
jgi:type III secretion system-like peptide-binding chaperone